MRMTHSIHFVHGCYLTFTICSIIWALFFSLVIRTIINGLRALATEKGTRTTNFWTLFRGFDGVDRPVTPWDRTRRCWAPDYWTAFALGSLELSTFPWLIAAGQFNYIGAWIGLKTIAQWKAWTEDRLVFNLFLLGQAMILIFSFIIAGFISHMARFD